MFDGPDYPKSLDEELFERWLEKGRQSNLGYKYLLVLWDTLEENFRPMYIEERSKIYQYEDFGVAVSQESLIAAYDLYSESRILPGIDR
ncbi:MAG: hypothetical protein ACI93L_002900 [Cyclobacteriaceae bacterium]|jgi:hypothetical protein